MSEYQLEIIGNIKLSDYSSVQDYMALVALDDKVTVTFDSKDSQETGIICNILEKENFKIVSKGGNESGKYYVKAYKEK